MVQITKDNGEKLICRCGNDDFFSFGGALAIPFVHRAVCKKCGNEYCKR